MNGKKPTAPDGFLREWLVLGSYAGKPQELAAKPLIPESTLLPSSGLKTGANTWSPLRSVPGIIDLMTHTPHWPHHAQCCGYAHVYLHSESEQTLNLALGSDDGAVLWLNGQKLFAMSGMRGNLPDQDRLPVRLGKGWNRILVKALQYDGAWSFCLRFLDASERPATGLSSSLDDPLQGRWPRPKATATPLALLLHPPSLKDCSTAAADSVVELKVLAQNLGDKELAPSALRVEDPATGTLSLKTPGLKPLESAELSFRLPLSSWARSYRDPLRFLGPLARPYSPIPELGHAFAAAAASAPQGLDKKESGQLHGLRREIAAASEALHESPGLSTALDTLTQALLGGDLGGTQEALKASLKQLDKAAEANMGQGVHLVGHAHIDMNWLWLWPETVQTCAETFAQALHFMEEFPDFRFTQSQAACYQAMQDEEPELFARIKAAVKAGRWNVVGGMWVEGDTNLSSGEAIARSLLLAQSYFKKELGIKAKVGWLPDNFGHCAQLPQMLRLAGIDAFYHSRTGPAHQLYWWEGLDGSRVLAKTGQGYNDQVSADLRRQPRALPKAVGEQMFVYGVGDHGGGPTRADIELARSFQDLKLFPKIKFSTADAYFDSVRPKAAGLHVQKGELGYIFEGCYTNIAKIKQGNRDLENALQSAEALALAAWKQGLAWPKAALDSAWKTLAFNEFHDILPGSAIHPSNDDSRASYAGGLQLAHQVRKKSLRYLAAKVGIPHAEGIPVLVFNPLAWQRSEIAVAELVVTERFHDVTLFDAEGKEVPAQVLKAKDFGPDFHIWVQFLAKDVPSLGYQSYRLRLNPGPGKVSISEWGHFSPEPATLPAPLKSAFKRDGLKIKGPHYEVEFDAKDGSIKSLKPLLKGKPGKNIFGRAGANRLGIYMEKPHPMSAWTLDPYAEGPLPLKSLGKVEIQQEGPGSLTLRAELGWGRSKFWLSTTLHAESPRIDCSLKVDWLETGTPSVPGPMLRALWQLASAPKALTCDVPYGVLEREPGREVAAQKWVDVAVPDGGLALFNRGKYGHSLEKDTLRLSLLRSSYDPDPYPDLGQHEIQWALQFHAGDYRKAGLARAGLSYNVPLECYQARTQKGPLPARHSFFALDSGPDFVATGIKKSEKGNGVVLRGYDAGGKGCGLGLPKAAQELDLLEEPLSSGKKKAVKLKPWGIVSLRMD